MYSALIALYCIVIDTPKTSLNIQTRTVAQILFMIMIYVPERRPSHVGRSSVRVCSFCIACF